VIGQRRSTAVSSRRPEADGMILFFGREVTGKRSNEIES
jgi:hypothetical protein